MQQVASREEMQEIDAYNINELGIPGIVLMERASLTLADEITSRFSSKSKVVVLAERGNNGGDGLAAGRILMARGFTVSFYEIGAVPKASDSYRIQRNILEKTGARFLDSMPEEDPDIWIDALFGVGLTRDVGGIHAQVIEELNRRKGYVVAVDLPSGIDASNGQIRGIAVKADLTITFGLMKLGLILYPGTTLAGETLVKEMGFMPESIKAIGPETVTFGPEDLSLLPRRKPWSNKGTYGKVLLITGTKNMAGAALLAGKACYRAGAGLVRILTDESNRIILQQGLPDAIFSPYEELEKALSWASVIGIGPGLGRSDRACRCVELALIHGKAPLVIDADGLNVLADMMRERGRIRELYENYPYGIILTPHLGEMSRLIGESIGDIRQNLIPAARSVGDPSHVIVLKDARTVVAGGGSRIYLNTSGNHGMAVGGSGDVLTGLICGLLAQYPENEARMRKEEDSPMNRLVLAARLGVYCHGLAGDYAAKHMGQRGLMASDLPDAAAKVFGGECFG